MKEPGRGQKRWSRYILLTVGIGLLLPAVQVAGVAFFNPPVTVPMFLRSLTGRFNPGWRANQYHWVALTNVPESFSVAVWSIEDIRFCEHVGFDWQQIQAAIQAAKASGKPSRGASTITQQCARSLFLWQGRSWLRKGLEAYYTVWMELLLSKRRIFELYVNAIELGDGVYGVEAAAQEYYGVPAQKLTRDQSIMLVAVMPDPGQWNPLDPNLQVLKRKEAILRRTKFARLPDLLAP